MAASTERGRAFEKLARGAKTTDRGSYARQIGEMVHRIRLAPYCGVGYTARKISKSAVPPYAAQLTRPPLRLHLWRSNLMRFKMIASTLIIRPVSDLPLAGAFRRRLTLLS